jgi:hypothetical protein
MAYFLDWAAARGDNRPRPTLGQVWQNGANEPLVQQFMKETSSLEVPSLTITPKMREAIMKGQTDFAEGGSVQGYADGGSASGSASNSLADLYEKYYGDPTTRISYAQGGSVDSVPVYDPAVIAAIAASITEDNYA